MKYRIRNPYKAAILNEFYEVIIDGTIYKYVDEQRLTTGDLSFVDDVISIRNTNSFGLPGMILIDEFGDTEVEIRSGCTSDLTEIFSSNEGPTGNSKIINFSPLNNLGEVITFDCWSNLTIDWGDGNVTTSHHLSHGWGSYLFGHNYDNPSPGDCETYTITFTIDIEGLCTPCEIPLDNIYTSTIDVEVCSTFDCTIVECGSTVNAEDEVIYNGGNNKIRYNSGYECKYSFLNKATVWAEMTHYHLKNNK